MIKSAVVLVLAFLLLGFGPSMAAEGWKTYRGAGFVIDLPADYVEAVDSRSDHLVLVDATDTVLVEVYSGQNPEALTASGLADRLAATDRIADVTYRAEGRTWFVLSGHYRRDGPETQSLIYYAKFFVSGDRSRLAGFEISYPRRDKASMDPVVERLEDTFRRR